MIDQYISPEAQIAFGLFVAMIVGGLIEVFVAEIVKFRKQQRRIRELRKHEAERKEVDRMLARLETTL